jgi:hypothetical protein
VHPGDAKAELDGEHSLLCVLAAKVKYFVAIRTRLCYPCSNNYIKTDVVERFRHRSLQIMSWPVPEKG